MRRELVAATLFASGKHIEEEEE